MEIFPLLELPKDLISLLLNSYFHPVTALRCLRVCKRLNELGDRKKIIFNALKFRMEEDFINRLHSQFICPQCFAECGNKGSYKNHLRKHRNGQIKTSKNVVLSKCENCGVSKSNLTFHDCLVGHKIFCCSFSPSYSFSPLYLRCEWAEHLSISKKWYISDPNRQIGKCYIICKACKEISTDKDFRNVHLLSCPNRNEIDDFKLKNPEKWEMWKKENLTPEHILKITGESFVQKPYL